MNKKTAFLLIALYLIILALDCFFTLNVMTDFRIYTKPLLMPVLYILLMTGTVETKHKRSKLYISLVVLFSFLGDFALLNSDNRFYFLAGVGFFGVAQFWYIMFFTRIKPFSVKRVTTLLILSVIIIAYLFFVISYIWQGIIDNVFLIPVLIYTFVVGVMLLSAFNTGTGRRVARVGFQNFIPGSILFAVSDSLLAITKFGPLSGAPLTTNAAMAAAVESAPIDAIIMVTYGIAQLLMINGAIRLLKK